MNRNHHGLIILEGVDSLILHSIRQLLWIALLYACVPVSAEIKESKAGLDIATVQEFDSLDRDKNRSLSDLEFAFSEIAQRARDYGDRKMIDLVFKRVDRNKDGGIGLL